MLLASDLFVVAIDEQNRQRAAGERFVIVFGLLDVDRDALVLDHLAGPIQRTIGEEDGASVGLGSQIAFVVVVVAGGGQLMLAVFGVQEEALVAGQRNGKQAILVGLSRRPNRPHVASGTVPRPNLSVSDWIASDGVQHETFGYAFAVLGPCDERQIADPEVRERDDVVLVTKTGIVAGDQEIEARFQILRRR